MAFFNKKIKKKTPTIAKLKINNIKLHFDFEFLCWEFEYKGHYFIYSEKELSFPKESVLESILDTITNIQSEVLTIIKQRLGSGVQIDSVSLSDILIELIDPISELKFNVIWNNEEIGEISATFYIENKTLIGDRWGD